MTQVNQEQSKPQIKPPVKAVPRRRSTDKLANAEAAQGSAQAALQALNDIVQQLKGHQDTVSSIKTLQAAKKRNRRSEQEIIASLQGNNLAKASYILNRVAQLQVKQRVLMRMIPEELKEAAMQSHPEFSHLL